MFRMLDSSVKDLLKSVIQLVYLMKGSIQYDDMMWRSPLERSMMEDFLVERAERMDREMKAARKGK